MRGLDIIVTISGHGGPPVEIRYATDGDSIESREEFVAAVCHPKIEGSIEREIRRRLGIEARR